MKYKEDILKLAAEGKTYKEIQDELGCRYGTIQYHLDPEKRERYHAATRKRRAGIRNKINEYKGSKPCADCNYSYPHYVMDFDHINEDKVMAVSKMIKHSSWDQVVQEIEKCELVCSNCHRERTWQRLRA